MGRSSAAVPTWVMAYGRCSTTGPLRPPRVDDFGKAVLLNMLAGSPGSGDDDTWTDGTATATAEARFAGNSQEFGYDAGLGYVKLFDITGSGFSVSGSTVLSFSMGAIWEWARADDCDEVNDTCRHTADHTICNDGQYCNGVETCDLLADCVDGPVPSGNDGFDCTADACNENTDTCDHTPNDAACSDGQYCNGVEVCEVGRGCVDGPDPDCDDGISCTVDECVEASDSCTHMADNHLCDHGDECTVDICTDFGCYYVDRCGACCLEDDTCTDDVGRIACENARGVFHGLGTSCAGDNDGDGRDDACAGPVDEIPTVSEWGLAVVALLLLIGGKIYFGRRQRAYATSRAQIWLPRLMVVLATGTC